MVSMRQAILLAVSLYSLCASTITFYIFVGTSEKDIALMGWKERVIGVEMKSKTTVIGNNIKDDRSIGVCEEKSLSLKGKLHVNSTFLPTEGAAIKSAGEGVVDGCYEPPNCISNQTVAIIIPYKNREQHLITLLYHLHPILQRQSLRYCIFVPEQHDDGAFNKARVMNAGFLEINRKGKYQFGCLIFHDVDMLLEDDRNLYRCGEVPRHLSPAIDKFRYKLKYGTNFGGVGAVSVRQYMLVNGHSNRFYGWGGEDSDIEERFKIHNITSQIVDARYGRYKMIPHGHPWNFDPRFGLGSYLNRISTSRFELDKKRLRESDSSGLSSIKYTVKYLSKNKLYTKFNIDVRTFLINYASSSFDGFNSRVHAENPAVIHNRLDTTKREKTILGFGIEMGDAFPNHLCTFKTFYNKTVNLTLGVKVNHTYSVSYDNLHDAKSKCLELARYCGSILETSPGNYSLRSSLFMHELTLKYKLGKHPQMIFTEKHHDIAVHAKICSNDTRYLQILDVAAVLSKDKHEKDSVGHESEFHLQLFQTEEFKLYYTYSIYSAHKAVIQEKEIIINASLGIYDSLGSTHSGSILVFDTKSKDSYEKFIPDGYQTLDQLAKAQETIELRTTKIITPLMPGCYVCESVIKDDNDVIHMKWKWWFEVRGKTKKLEERLLNSYLPHAEVRSTHFTEELQKRFLKSMHLPAGSELSDDILKIVANKQAHKIW